MVKFSLQIFAYKKNIINLQEWVPFSFFFIVVIIFIIFFSLRFWSESQESVLARLLLIIIIYYFFPDSPRSEEHFVFTTVRSPDVNLVRHEYLGYAQKMHPHPKIWTAKSWIIRQLKYTTFLMPEFSLHQKSVDASKIIRRIFGSHALIFVRRNRDSTNRIIQIVLPVWKSC